MPEGHTLHRIASGLTEFFARRRVEVTSPQGRFAASAALLDRSVLRGAESAGKHLLIEFSGRRWVHVHLGLIGSFVVVPGAAPPPRGAVRLRLRTSKAYADLRGPTSCELVTDKERRVILDRLGPDPLRPDVDPDRAWRRISRSRVPIAALLLDQDVVAGMGNVYRAELLFRHRIPPLLPGQELTRAQWSAMWADLVELMHEGVATGRIDSVRHEHLPEAMGRPPRVDNHGGEVYVYRRAGLPCHVCGTGVEIRVLAGRNLFWCPHCQAG